MIGSRSARKAVTLAGRLASGWAGEPAGAERREMASDAETARRGGNEEEKTEAGELIRCEAAIRPEC